MKNMFQMYLYIFMWNLIVFWQLSKSMEMLFLFFVGNTFMMLILMNLYEKFNYTVEDVIDKLKFRK